MQLTYGAVYTLHALAYLARAEPGRVFSSDLIAEAEHIPQKFLVKLFRRLVAVRILRSRNGPGGGFQLARPPEQLTLLEILESMEGTLTVCLPNLDAGDPVVARKVQRICDHVTEAVRRVLGKVSLRDLAGGRSKKGARG